MTTARKMTTARSGKKKVAKRVARSSKKKDRRPTSNASTSKRKRRRHSVGGTRKTSAGGAKRSSAVSAKKKSEKKERRKSMNGKKSSRKITRKKKSTAKRAKRSLAAEFYEGKNKKSREKKSAPKRRKKKRTNTSRKPNARKARKPTKPTLRTMSSVVGSVMFSPYNYKGDSPSRCRSLICINPSLAVMKHNGKLGDESAVVWVNQFRANSPRLSTKVFDSGDESTTDISVSSVDSQELRDLTKSFSQPFKKVTPHHSMKYSFAEEAVDAAKLSKTAEAKLKREHRQSTSVLNVSYAKVAPKLPNGGLGGRSKKRKQVPGGGAGGPLSTPKAPKSNWKGDIEMEDDQLQFTIVVSDSEM